MGDPRIDAQVDFLLAADGLKSVQRKVRLFDGSRAENTAEHSWHLTLMALALAEYASPGTDIPHVVELLIVHDLVEVYAGDHWLDGTDAALVARKEAAAAETLFRLLPDDQASRLHNLWKEFEAKETPESRFAKALDVLHPMLLIWGPGGTGCTHTPLTAAIMRDIKRATLEPFPALWNFAQSLLDKAVARGVLPLE